MLKSLLISNLAVVHRLRLNFGQGLSVLTGETGAGKSIVVDALGLLVGGRATADIVRTGEKTAVIEGTFELEKAAENSVRSMLDKVGVELAEEDLVIRREIQFGGRGRIFINDQSVTSATLRSLQPFLVEIHGQGEPQILLPARGQLDLLDEFGGGSAQRVKTASAYARWKDARAALSQLARDEAERERRMELLRFQLDELQKFNPVPGEKEELEQERVLLLHLERALQLKSETYLDWYESDQSILSRLATVRRRLQEWLSIDKDVGQALEVIENAVLSLTDVAENLRSYGDDMDFSAARLAAVENRLAEFEKLSRKYGVAFDDLSKEGGNLTQELENLTHWSEREQELQTALDEAELEYVACARRLTDCRVKAAQELEPRVQRELRYVALEGSSFLIRVRTALLENRACADAVHDAGAEGGLNSDACFWTASGADKVEFFLSANVGENVRPLSAAKRGRRSGVTMIFDEIDTGIGGRVAEAVGRRLQALAETQQVLCVTHQPQIARFADHHFASSKHVEGERTVTAVSELDAAQRVSELARMIGGDEDASTARETAPWLLSNAFRRGQSEAPSKVKSRKGRSNEK
jgi:DNA repair protein RecN (Recombination protein N)